MYDRLSAAKIREHLTWNPAVAILGPRQVGKTTLARRVGEQLQATYLDLENPRDIQKLHDPVHYLDLHADNLVIIDEVQRYPDLFTSLRSVIDARRHEGKGNGRLLILGSATNNLLRQSSESLAGRISYLELAGLNPLEIGLQPSDNLDKLWLRGGFPSSYTAARDKVSFTWRKNFIKTYLERDIPQLGPRISATTLMRFWTMLAHSQGELLNASKLAASLGVKSVTVSRYLDLLVDLLLVRKLEPWFGNVKKRLVRAPRVYVRDSGLLHSLLNISDYEQLLGHPILGKSWEGFVIENILNNTPEQMQTFFYRTAVGAEIDLLLQIDPETYWALEIKASRIPKLSKGFHIACADLGVRRKLVIYPGSETFSLGNDTLAVPLPEFLQELHAQE